MFYVFPAVCLFGSAFAASTMLPPSSCPTFDTMKNWDIDRYLGVWYTQRAIRPTQDGQEKCYIVEYDVDENHDLRLFCSEISRNGEITFQNGTARALDPAKPTKFTYVEVGGTRTFNYWLLDTDYDNFAITYDCEYPDSSLWVTILTRELNPAESVINKALEICEKHNIDISMLFIDKPILCQKAFIESRVSKRDE